MKKKLSLLILPLLLLVASCDYSTSSSIDSSLTTSSISESSDTSSSISSSSAEASTSSTPVYDSSEIIDTLLEASEGNYTLSSTSEYGYTYQTIFTENYYYTTYSYPYQGVILLDNIDSTSDDSKVCYNFEINGDEVLLGTQVTSSNQYVTDINSNYNSLSLISDSYTADLLTDNYDGTFTLENDSSDTLKVTLLGILGYVLGYDASLLGYVSGATLTSLSDGALDIQFNLLTAYVGQIDDELLHATISDVGSSEVTLLEEFIVSNPFDNETLSSDNADVLKRTEGKTISSVDLVAIDPYTGVEERVEVGTFEINFDEDHLFSVMTQSGKKSYENFYRNSGDYLVDGVAEGNGYSININYNNELVYTDAGEDFDSLVGDRGLSQLDDILSLSYQNADGSYTYHGTDADNYLLYLTGGLSVSSVSYLTFEVENGQVTSVSARYGQDTLYGITYYYSINLTFDEKDDFEDPAVFTQEANEGDKEALTEAFEHFNSQTTYSYKYYDLEDKESSPTNYDYTQVYVSEDISLTISYYSGYTVYKGTVDNGDGTLEDFELTYANGTYTATTSSDKYTGSLEDANEITINPLVLESSDENTYTPRPYVTNLAEGIIDDVRALYMDDYTFTLSLDDDNHLASYSYYYNLYGYYYGTRVYEFSFGDDGEIPSSIKTAIENRSDWVVPTTWECAGSVYNPLQTLFGDFADQIPFIYYSGVTDDNHLTGYLMQGGYQGYNSFVYAYGYTDYTPEIQEFVDAYVEYLENYYSETYVKTEDYYINYATYDVAYVNEENDIVIVPNYTTYGEYGIYFFYLDA